uniref:Gem (nuclear organelle) associated protein 8 n=1 Tax=Electrophorus electricus TaxID=8005 RepID=A0AAY5EUF0_ELEEL
MSAWYAHPVYTRYWQHYQLAMSWHRRHWRAYNKAWRAAYGPAPYPVFPAFVPAMQTGILGRRVWKGQEHARGWGGREKRVEEEEGDSNSEAENEESWSSEEGEIECDVSNMDISAELRQYFAQTEQHREELKRQHQIEAERQEAYVPADQDLRRAPRSAEMKRLYGKDALTFDRNCDRKHPKYWPVIPLNL